MSLDLITIEPEWIIAAFALAVILLDLFVKDKLILTIVSLVGLVFSGVYTAVFAFQLDGMAQSAFNGMLALDYYALFFKLLFLGTAFLVILASHDYLKKLGDAVGEYYVLILLSTLGMMLMASTTELITIYIALELTSISLYALVGLLKDEKSTESSLKYLLLGAVASAVLLYGMAMVYGFTGETQLGAIAHVLRGMSGAEIMTNPALLLGIVMLIAGFGFKIAAVPFQLWVPDVYEGAPTTITAFLSVGSKAAGFAVIMRVFSTAFGSNALSSDWGMIFAVLAVISMFVGNVAAIPQNNIKRMLGYSSIAQAGYLMVGLATIGLAGTFKGELSGQSGIMFFLASYALTNLGAFIAIIAITNALNSDNISDFAGMGKRAPVLALALTLCLISLVGMPPAAGFMAKFYIFRGAVQSGLLWLVIVAVINSVISAYYYLRVVKVMWFNPAASEDKVKSSAALTVSLAIACLGVLAFGIVPNILIEVAKIAGL